MRLLVILAALLASMALAAPAMADDAVVGEGQVITDMATEVEPPPGEDDGTDIPPVDDGTPAPAPEPDASGRRGEIHVLDSATSSTDRSAAAPAAAAASPVRTAARPQAGARARTLPFTGIDAGPLALIGLALLGAGGGLLAVLRQPVQ